MAINVNDVYQTVLFILNKEQRGSMTPQEFSSIATQVQLEIFDKYFEDLIQTCFSNLDSSFGIMVFCVVV